MKKMAARQGEDHQQQIRAGKEQRASEDHEQQEEEDVVVLRRADGKVLLFPKLQHVVQRLQDGRSLRDCIRAVTRRSQPASNTPTKGAATR